MSHSQYLRDLLRPLGIYDLEAPFNGGELDAQGEALDRAMAALEEIQRESSLTTAESWGLEQVARLFLRRPVATQPRPLADALAALLRIGGDSFTLEAINDTILGCGICDIIEYVPEGGPEDAPDSGMPLASSPALPPGATVPVGSSLTASQSQAAESPAKAKKSESPKGDKSKKAGKSKKGDKKSAKEGKESKKSKDSKKNK